MSMRDNVAGILDEHSVHAEDGHSLDYLADAIIAALDTDAKDARIAELKERIGFYENEKIMANAAYDGVSSLLLSVQQDCIKSETRIAELEAELAEADSLISAAFADGSSNNVRLAETSHRVKELEALNAELVNALDGRVNEPTNAPDYLPSRLWDAARKALAKAKATQ